MPDSFEQEMERREQLIVEKLAEIGITVHGPVSFAKIPNGPIGGQIGFVWEDSAPVQQAFDADDEFTRIMMAEKEMEKVQREEQIKTGTEQALADLAKLADGILEDDDDD